MAKTKRRPPRPSMGSEPAPPAGRRRFARLLVERYPELSFSRAKEVIAAGQVDLEGRTATDPGQWVSAQAKIAWRRDRPRRRQYEVEIVYVAGEVVVVEKPAGLLTQPTSSGEKETVIGLLSDRLGRREGKRPFLAVVHRLDKETSGLLVFARSLPAQRALQEELKERALTRQYLALVEGAVRGEAGTFDRALAGDGVHEKRHVVRRDETGRAAVTHWQVRERLAGATWLEVSLETGRTHQIRIHFSAAGNPVVGEWVYRPSGGAPPPIAFGRLALHAARLAFVHPGTGERRVFESALPADLVALLARLRSAARAAR